MRNLKRVLSLALASVMLLGMMVIGASAVSINDFTDQDEIVNKEAVALLVDLGIVNGKSDTNFGATDTLERTALAKMVYIALTGTDDASMYADMNVFSDVTAANCWAAGFINYCYSVDILSGVGGDRFSPYSSLTVAQTAKALLVALGYIPDAEISMYEGNDWAINVMRDAQAKGLLAGIGQSAHASVTRDNAARMIFNALFATTVTPEYQYDMGNRYVTKYTNDTTTLGAQVFSLGKITATVDEIVGGKASVKDVKPTGAQTIVDEKLDATPDMVGTSVVAYYNTDTNALYSSVLTAGTTNVLGTSSNGTSIADLSTRTNKNYISAISSTASFFLNGKAAATTDTTPADGIPDAMETAAAKAGVVVEFIDSNGDGVADIVKATEQTVDFVTGAVSTRTSNNVLQVNIPGVTSGWVAADTVVGYEGLAKDDVVLTVTIDSVTYIEKAASIQGTVSSKNSDDTVTVNGVKYAASGLGGKTYTDFDTNLDYVNTYTFYLDNGSNIVAVKKVTSVNADQYAVILDIVYIEGTVSAGSSSNGYAEAQVLYSDGTTEVKRVATIDGYIPVKVGTDLSTSANIFANNSDSTKVGSDALDTVGKKLDAYSGTTAGSRTAVKYIAVSDVNTPTTLEGVFYTYTTNTAGNLVMTTATPGSKTVTGAITTGNAKFSAGTAIGNAATVFLVKEGKEYKVYTGIANVPSGTVSGTAAVLENTSGIATYVYMTLTVASETDTDYVYVTSTVWGTSYDASTGTTTYVFDAIVDGEATTISVDANTYATLDAVGLYNVTFTDGVITAAADAAGKPISAVGGGVLVLTGDTNAYTYDSNTVVYLFEGDSLTSMSNGDSLAMTPDGYTDSVVVVKAPGTNPSNLLDVVYIVRTVAP